MDASQITQLLQQFTSLLARIAATHEADSGLQEDLIQDMSVAIWRALDSSESGASAFRGEASVKTYITRIAHNRAVDHVLKELRRHESPSSDEMLFDHKLQEKNAHQENAIDLMTALHQLPLPYRQVIALQLEGFSFAEIGNVLGLKEDAIAQRSHRARKQLEQIMNRN